MQKASTANQMRTMEVQGNPQAGEESGTRQFLHCRPGAEQRLVRLEDIVECIPMVELDEQQRADHPQYRGLLHFRGRVVPVFDLAEEHGQPLEPSWFLIVLRARRQEIAVVARQVFEILTSAAADYESVDIGHGQSLTVVSSDSQMLQVLEPEKLLLG